MILMLWTFVFAFVVYCPHFFYSMVYIISLQSKFSPGPKKKYTRPDRKLPRSRPDPFSWARTGPILGLSKIWPRDPSRVGVARSGPGIPDGPGCPARLYVTNRKLTIIDKHLSRVYQCRRVLKGYYKICWGEASSIFNSGHKPHTALDF